jgi:hypothetical protein
LGNLLPDAYTGKEVRKVTHYVTEIEDGKTAYFGFDQFRKEFQELVLTDDLYLGYYMHLVVDAFYRDKLYNKLNLRNKLQTYDDVKILHNDYRLLNPYIIEKYGVTKEIVHPENWEDERIGYVFPFTLESCFADMEKDYTTCSVGSTQFVTEQALDEFVEEYVDLCVREIQSVKKNEEYLSPLDFKYEYIDMK